MEMGPLNTRKAWLVLATAVLVSVLHAGAQFVAWAYTDGNTVGTYPPSALAKRSWAVLSGPLLWMVGEERATESFGLLLLLNSVLWGCAAAAGLALVVGRGRSAAA